MNDDRIRAIKIGALCGVALMVITMITRVVQERFLGSVQSPGDYFAHTDAFFIAVMLLSIAILLLAGAFSVKYGASHIKNRSGSIAFGVIAGLSASVTFILITYAISMFIAIMQEAGTTLSLEYLSMLLYSAAFSLLILSIVSVVFSTVGAVGYAIIKLKV